MADRKLSSFDEMGYDNSTKVLIPALKYSSNDPNAQIENRNIPLELFYRQPLFKYDWYEYLLNDPNWIRCDTFSWHSGDSQEANSYEKVYQHLVDDINGKTLQSETVAGITIQFYLADDTHKICPASEEQNLINLYNTTGIAWYYLIDEENIRFKLPRTKWGFIGLRDEVGKYVPETLPNIKGKLYNYPDQWGVPSSSDYDGALYPTSGVSGGTASNKADRLGTINFDASLSNSTYQNNAPVQQRATQMYLYCYIGGFTQTSLENIAGQNMSIVNQKADTNLLNTDNNVDFIIDSQEPTAENNYTGYDLYRSGKITQKGRAITNSSNPCKVILPVKMTDIYYNINIVGQTSTDGYSNATWQVMPVSTSTSPKSTTSFYAQASITGYNLFFYWEVSGKADLT